MKKYICFLFMALGIAVANAQDVIVLRNTEEIEAKVLEINPESVKYVPWDFQDGPVRVVDKRDIFFIKYQNGQKETFELNETPNNGITGRLDVEQTRGKYIHRIKPQGNVYAGMVFNGWDWNIGPALDLAYGARFYDYFFLGLDLGYSCWFENVYNGPYYRTALHFASLRLNMKGYWPVSENLSPFLNLDLGTSIWVAGFAFFNMQVGAGVEFRRFSLGMGYNLLSLFGEDVHSGYLWLGVRF